MIFLARKLSDILCDMVKIIRPVKDGTSRVFSVITEVELFCIIRQGTVLAKLLIEMVSHEWKHEIHMILNARPSTRDYKKVYAYEDFLAICTGLASMYQLKQGLEGIDIMALNIVNNLLIPHSPKSSYALEYSNRLPFTWTVDKTNALLSELLTPVVHSRDISKYKFQPLVTQIIKDFSKKTITEIW